MDVPKVSVIVPFRNGERYLARAFKCMEKIVFPSWELIFIDDGSTDGGHDILTNLSQASPLNMLVIRNHTSLGAGEARNEGVRAATGEFVWFADCDDEWSPNILSHLWSGIGDDAVDVVVCDLEKVYEMGGGRLVVKDAPFETVCTGTEAFNRVLCGGLQGHLVNKLIRRELLVQNPMPSIRAHEDLACLLKVLWSAKAVSFVPGVMYSYLLHGGSLMHSTSYRWEDLLEVAKIADGVVAEEPRASEVRRRLDEFKLSHILVPAASAMAAQGKINLVELPFVEKIHLRSVLHLLKRKRYGLAAKSVLLSVSPNLYGVVRNRFVGRKVLY